MCLLLFATFPPAFAQLVPTPVLAPAPVLAPPSPSLFVLKMGDSMGVPPIWADISREARWRRCEARLEKRPQPPQSLILRLDSPPAKPSKTPRYSVKLDNPNIRDLEYQFNLSLAGMEALVHADDNSWMAGESWKDGTWTRDDAFSEVLAGAPLYPEVSKSSLMVKVKNGKIIQDTGTGGSWPVSTDRVAWGMGAWEVYLRGLVFLNSQRRFGDFTAVRFGQILKNNKFARNFKFGEVLQAVLLQSHG